jgi:hypothetical protein
MKRVLLYFLFSLLCPALRSQMVYFFSIDADGPFTLQAGNQTFRSTATGHLLLPNLKDSTFLLSISLTDQPSPRLRFQVPVNRKDRGFQLKKNDGASWALFDWQQVEWINALPEQSLNEPIGEKRDDAFAHLMAGVVNDTVVLYSQRSGAIPNDSLKTDSDKASASKLAGDQVIRENQPIAELRSPADSSTQRLLNSDSALQNLNTAATADLRTDNSTNLAQGKQTFLIRRLGDSTLRDTRYLLYCDSSEIGVDTIAVRIPIQSESKGNPKDDKVAVPAKQPVAAIKKEPAKVPPNTKDSLLARTTVGNKGCLNTANDTDLDKLRIRMLQETTPDGRLEVARKAFRAQCYSTKQIRGLTELFFSDENRYLFFDAAYPSTIDKEPFKALVFFLTDDYYINRFKAMVRY